MKPFERLEIQGINIFLVAQIHGTGRHEINQLRVAVLVVYGQSVARIFEGKASPAALCLGLFNRVHTSHTRNPSKRWKTLATLWWLHSDPENCADWFSVSTST